MSQRALISKQHWEELERANRELREAHQLLEQRVAERTRQLSTLLDVSRSVTSTLELKPLLGLILDQLKTVLDYSAASILGLDGEMFQNLAYRGPAPQEMVMRNRYPANQPFDRQVITTRQPVILPDLHGDSHEAQTFRGMVARDTFEQIYGDIHTWMRAPLIVKDQAIGMLTVHHREPNRYNMQDAALLMAFANQAAVAMENARLYEQAQSLAALQERQKLARELHDSVSQALYGIALGLHTAFETLERAEGGLIEAGHLVAPLEYAMSLTDAGMAEMRALIFELRPESLQKEGLVAALQKQAAALSARHQITVQSELDDEPDIPLRVKEALYRVAQEALHNIVKHARASLVTLKLARNISGVVLEIRDNGRGFDPNRSYPGHLGLHSMRERLTGINGTLTIESTPGVGTSVRAELSQLAYEPLLPAN